MRSARIAVILDCCCVLVFVVIGRARHVQGESLAGIASTAWPFLVGLAGGWLAARAWRQPFRLWPAGVGAWLRAGGPGIVVPGVSGVGAWLGAVALGMVLRVVSGQGTALAFIGVALAFLGLFLLGWRLLAGTLRRSPAPARPGRGRSRR